MNTFLPALRGGSLLRPFFADIFREFEEPGWQPTLWSSEITGFPMDVAEFPDHYLITADLPGRSNQDLNITLVNSQLSIEVTPQAEVQSSKDGEAKYLFRERRSGAVRRTIVLPYSTSEENIDAVLKDGVLTITVKKDQAMLPRRIKVH